MNDAKGLSMNHVLGGQLHIRNLQVTSSNENAVGIRVDTGEEDGGQGTARYLAPQTEFTADEQALSSFGGANA